MTNRANKSRLLYAARKLKYTHNLFVSHFERTIAKISGVLDVVTAVASVACLVVLAIYIGYTLSPTDKNTLKLIMRCAQGVFGFSILFSLIFRLKHTLRTTKIIKWIADILLLLTLIAWAYPHPAKPWLPWLEAILYSNKFTLIVLGAYSIVSICYTLSRIPSKRTNPSVLMASSFLFFIIIGSFTLMLPRCTYHGISYVDSLFVSASAVCITGLTSVDIPSTFTPFGILVISVLVQLGSLGVITFTSFFALFFTGNASIYNQLLLRDMVYSKSMNSLIPTLLYVLGFTITVELLGALAVYFTVPEALGMDIDEKMIFSAFHSMSSFCNAGFSCLPGGMANPALMNSNQNIYIVTSVLIFAGAVGFPILVNFKEILKHYITRLWYWVRRRRYVSRRIHIFDLNTKMVLYTTLSILAICSVAFFIFEYDNSLAGMSTYKKCVQSVFNSLIPRSAGFASLNPSNFLNVTILLILVQMFIGGSSQSMAGGIKVNTVGVILLNIRAAVYGHKDTVAFQRAVNPASVRRANAVLALGFISLFAYIVVLMLLEPSFSAKAVIFEATSALFTVGSSLGITPMLSDVSKAVLCTAMFMGRVGLLSLLMGLMPKPRDPSDHLPVDNIIIN